MTLFVRIAGSMTCLMIAAGIASAATESEIQAAIKKGTDALRAMNAQGGGGGAPVGGGATHGIGPSCLAGLAMLESGVPVTDPALKAVTTSIRNAAFSQVKTYQLALCLLYIDRFGDPADVPLIQILAVRLLAGQTVNGGWGYDCVGGVQQADEQRLRAIKAVNQPGAPKLHPEVEKYQQSIGGRPLTTDDNSNTQFAVIAIWLARKHGVPVDNALDGVEKRFMATQSSRTGGWPYNGPLPGSPVGDGPPGSPAMYCAGLIGLSTSIARREERRTKSETPKKDDPAKTEPKKTSDDPFFNPPAPKINPEPKKHASRPLDARDLAIRAGFTGLGNIVAESAQAGRGALIARTDAVLGQHDFYFLWSLERTCVIYGTEKLGGVNWYDAGAHTLVVTQSQNGTWGANSGGYGTEVNTSFAVLFLCRSNLARDLSGKVQNETGTEMRAGAGPGSNETKPINPSTGASNTNTVASGPIIPGASGSEVATMAAELVRATDKDWTTVLRKLRDSKGSAYTEALVTATNRLEGDRLKSAREALAERLTRMTAETLRSMAKSEEAELRRASLLAMAMKDDKNHVPDLIAAILDDEEFVVRAAKAGLKSLSGQDFGPAANANVGEKKIAVDAWKNWWSKQKK